MVLRKAASLLALWAVAFLLAAPGPIAVAGGTSPGSDKSRHDREKQAFESAKELGTAEAWNAFLANYPSGFHADLARAYLKKLSDKPAAATAARGIAQELSCAARTELRSMSSDVPTKLTFANRSGMYRSILWFDFNGKLQDFGGLNSGEQLEVNTFLTHPWMIATGPGDCLQIFLPAAGAAIVDLVRLAADDGPRKVPAEVKQKPVQQQAQQKKPLVCGKNYSLSKGKCVPTQNCGKNAYRSAGGDCHCNKGYQMRKGKCVWPQDKQGFEVAPWKKSGCPGLQARCNRGDGPACMRYEEKCQVN